MATLNLTAREILNMEYYESYSNKMSGHTTFYTRIPGGVVIEIVDSPNNSYLYIPILQLQKDTDMHIAMDEQGGSF